MRTSSSTTSGARSWVSWSASWPFTASPITSTSAISASRLRSRSRAGGSSSTMSTFSLPAGPMGSGRLRGGARGLLDERESQRHDVLRIEAPRFHERTLAVHEAQALADVGERQAVALALPGCGVERVAHHDGHEPAADLAGNGHRAALGARLDAMVDRVLEQRLDHEMGYQGIAGQRVGLPVHLQPPSQAQLLHALIGACDLELFRQGDGVALVAQGGAEQIRQVLHRLLGA